jgi:hypothetical protein
MAIQSTMTPEYAEPSALTEWIVNPVAVTSLRKRNVPPDAGTVNSVSDTE